MQKTICNVNNLYVAEDLMKYAASIRHIKGKCTILDLMPSGISCTQNVEAVPT